MREYNVILTWEDPGNVLIPSAEQAIYMVVCFCFIDRRIAWTAHYISERG